MPYDNDEARQAARERLAQRMDRRGTPLESPRPSSDARTRSGDTASRRRSQPQQEPQPSRLAAWAERLPVPATTLVAGIIAAIVLIAVMVSVVRCAVPANDPNPSATGSSSATDQQDSPSGDDDAEGDAQADTSNEMQEALADLIGEEKAAQLLETAKTDTQALWIAAHPEEYAFDGLEVQVKILKLAADEPKAIPYVRSYPAQYPAADEDLSSPLALDSHSPSADVPDTNIPHYYQWDPRWGNTVYSSAAFSMTGCGPTSLSMVYQGLTGATDLDPHQMAVLAEERGYMSEYNGTANTFFGEIADELGLDYEELYPSASNLTDALSSGHTVIAHLGPGLFTTRGHFFVLTGIADNGEVILNDPYSYERSSVTWPAETISNEATIYYSFSPQKK